MNQPRELYFSAPARIHCGLIAVDHQSATRYGGCGIMIAQPQTRIRLSTAAQWRLQAKDSPWWLRLVQQWQVHFCPPADSVWCEPIETWPLSIEVMDTPPRHVGLGSGTQAALLLASALCRWTNLPEPSVEELALAMGRAKRSAIGTYGFRRGGFLVDRGLTSTDPLATLDFQTALPTDWRVVLILPQLAPGISGLAELNAFEQQVGGSQSLYEQMRAILRRDLVPAASVGDFARFAEAVFQFNYLSGLNYAKVQSGAYHSAGVAEIVRQIREWGFAGVVQSSWGPTLAVLTPNETTANDLQGRLQSSLEVPANVIVSTIAGPSNIESLVAT